MAPPVEAAGVAAAPGPVAPSAWSSVAASASSTAASAAAISASLAQAFSMVVLEKGKGKKESEIDGHEIHSSILPPPSRERQPRLFFSVRGVPYIITMAAAPLRPARLLLKQQQQPRSAPSAAPKAANISRRRVASSGFALSSR